MRDDRSSRQKRRRRRLKNQFLAYLALIVIIILILAAGYVGVKAVIRYVNNYNDRVNRVIEEAESGIITEQESPTFDIQEETSSIVYNEGYNSPAEDNPVENLVEKLLNDMTVEEMVAGMFLVSPEAITGVETAIQAREGTKTALAENPVGGFVYAAKNYKSQEQFTQMLANAKMYSKYPLFRAVLAEGGAADYGLAATPKTSELADADSVTQAYGSISSALALYGVDMNLAPSVLGDAALTSAAVQAVQGAKISAVLRSFPGDAAASKSLDELQGSEFATYDAAIKSGVDCIMVSHASAKGITGDDTPSSMSSVVIQDVLRNTLGFRGVVMTAALNDSAVTGAYSPAEAAVAAVQAGADLLLLPEDYKEAYEGVLQAVTDGTITKERIRESMYRIYRVKYKNTL
ncbi:MAG: glycoside hydrolase family 3 protein [Lachnospiraceae bacterium]|nr:glycoside hydrolase family 3 protein [Lachnospiraceae bacterium]